MWKHATTHKFLEFVNQLKGKSPVSVWSISYWSWANLLCVFFYLSSFHMFLNTFNVKYNKKMNDLTFWINLFGNKENVQALILSRFDFGKKEKVGVLIRTNQNHRLEETHYLKYEVIFTKSHDILKEDLQKLFKFWTNYVSKRTPSIWSNLSHLIPCSDEEEHFL